MRIIRSILQSIGLGHYYTDPSLNEPLFVATREGDVEQMQALLLQGADVNAQKTDKMTPLHVAASRNNPYATECLIEWYGDMNARNKLNQTPLDLAIAYRGSVFRHDSTAERIETIHTLIAHGANVDTIDIDCNTPLYTASYQGDIPVMSMLLNAGAQVRGSSLRDSPLHAAAFNGHILAIDLLLDHEEGLIHRRDNNGNTVLHQAVHYSKPGVIDFLLTRGADIDGVNSEGLTPLNRAALAGSIEAMSCLIWHGADINATTLEGKTILHQLLHSGAINPEDSHNAITLLIGSGAVIAGEEIALIQKKLELQSQDVPLYFKGSACQPVNYMLKAELKEKWLKDYTKEKGKEELLENPFRKAKLTVKKKDDAPLMDVTMGENLPKEPGPFAKKILEKFTAGTEKSKESSVFYG
ncbi:MAG: uncharacterized protein K0R63_943 [Rickettsiales bacterium]|jgi:ankyrin repeat protein|nr:uncharacterized protein [Rickettsiales bacterium]